jgi:TetR/AcrR family transcriptional regulator, transcriptional repressor for nem operon
MRCAFFREPAEAMSKGELTRQRIVELAAPLFNRHGYAGCSMQEILDATGLKKGGLYRHFAGKQELAAEAFRHSLAQVRKIRLEGIDPSLNAIDRLREAARRFVELPSPVPGGCPILNTAIDADDGNPVLRRLAWEGLESWRSRIARIVREGIARHEIRRGVKPRELANTMIAALEGALMISRLEGSRTALKDVQRSLNRLLQDAAART